MKLEQDAGAGIAWYWIVDPEGKVLWEYRLVDDAHAIVSEPRGDAIFRPRLFPGLSIPLARLWGARPPG